MRILILSDNFFPEHNAPAQRVYDHAKRWAARGADVTVITGVPNFPTGKVQAPYRNKLHQREIIDGIKVVRVWTFLAANTGTVLRSLDFISYAVSSFLAGLFEDCDVIIATSPQLLTGLSGAVLATVKRRPWVFEVRDLWPDSITAVEAMRRGPLIAFLRWVEKHLYRAATHIVAVSGALRHAIADKGVAIEKISVVQNGATSRLKPEARDPELAESLQLTGKFIVGYVGTHGLAQDLETVLLAAQKVEQTHGREDIHFLFVGEGARRKIMQGMAVRLKLRNTTFLGPVSRVVGYLAMCDALVVPLKNSPIASGAIPSKIFDAAVMDKPVLLSVPGTAAELIAQYHAGLAVPPEKPALLAEAILRLANDPVLYESFRAGSRALAKDFARDTLADRMLVILEALVAGRQPEPSVVNA